MKIRHIFIAFTLLFALLLTACGSSKPQEQDTAPAGTTPAATSEQNTTGESTADTQESSSILVIYFSRTGEQHNVGVIDKGNTEIVAEMIAEELSADTFEIKPKNDTYPTTYDELTDVAKQEQNDGARPEYAECTVDLAKYDTIFIGAPVWWGDWPMICYTFFENEDLHMKTLIPFSTHEGSGLSGFDSKLAKVIPDSEIKEGLAIKGTDCQHSPESVKQKVSDWLSTIGY